MKIKSPKQIILPLLLIILLISLASCKPSGENPPEVTTEDVSDIVIFENGGFNFRLTRPYRGEDTKLYSAFYRTLREISGCEDIEFKTDAESKTEKYDSERLEILCGYTDYPESRKCGEYLEFESYRICFEGKKLAITARTTESLELAIDDLTSYMKENTKDGRLSIPSNFVMTGKVKNAKYGIITNNSPAVKAYRSADYSDCGDGYRQITLHGVSEEIFLDYRASLEQNGFTLHAENSMANNLFATYTKEKVMIHTYYTPHNEEIRIVGAKTASLPSTEEVTYEKKTNASFTLMGLEKSGEVGGFGAIIGLEDGSFIVIDGGNNTAAEAKDLRDTLIKLSPDKKKVTVRAWVLTHGHGDHFGAFVKFSKSYAQQGIFDVESFIFNYCDTPEQQKHSTSCSYQSTWDAIETYWTGAAIYKGLTGQVYRFAGCDMEVLYCMSDFLPQIIGEEKGISDINKDKVDGNIENMVTRFKLSGQRILVTGDTTKVNIDEMCARYGEYLASELMTVPHHGHNRNSYRARNSTKEFYTLVNPTTVFWPSAASKYDERLAWNGKAGGDYEENYYLINSLNVKECVVAGAVTKTFVLPYTPK